MTHRSTPRIAQVVALAAALFAVPVAASAATALVVNNRDEGPGSFRYAIERANNDASIDTIQFLFTVGTVRLQVDGGVHRHAAAVDSGRRGDARRLEDR